MTALEICALVAIGLLAVLLTIHEGREFHS